MKINLRETWKYVNPITLLGLGYLYGANNWYNDLLFVIIVYLVIVIIIEQHVKNKARYFL